MKIDGEIHRKLSPADIPGELGQRIGPELERDEEQLLSVPFSRFFLR